MGASTRDIFGADVRGEPAEPGTYGQAPVGYRLPDGTHVGAVTLRIADLERSLEFYERTLGFRTVHRDEHRAVLAAHGDDRPLIELRAREGARPAPRRGRLGLYHFAILLPDRPSLGRFVRHLGEIGARAGAGDHLVSEAFYLQDPDNLGIEVYADRPRESWRRVGRELMMSTDPVDVPGLVAAAGSEPWIGMPAGTTIGHVHLHVGDIAQAAAFFADALGFDRTVWDYPGALFLAAGGYHHHVGTNIWAGPDATPAGEDDAQLLEWSLVLPDADDVSAAADSVTKSGFAIERNGDAPEFVVRDPWGTPVRVLGTSGDAGASDA